MQWKFTVWAVLWPGDCDWAKRLFHSTNAINIECDLYRYILEFKSGSGALYISVSHPQVHKQTDKLPFVLGKRLGTPHPLPLTPLPYPSLLPKMGKSLFTFSRTGFCSDCALHFHIITTYRAAYTDTNTDRFFTFVFKRLSVLRWLDLSMNVRLPSFNCHVCKYELCACLSMCRELKIIIV